MATKKAAALRKNIKKVRDRVAMPNLPLEADVPIEPIRMNPDLVIGDDESITLDIPRGDMLSKFEKHENEVMLAARRRINDIVAGRDADVLEGPSKPIDFASEGLREMRRIRSRIDAIVGDDDVFGIDEDKEAEVVKKDDRIYPTRLAVRLHKLILEEVSTTMDTNDDWIGTLTNRLADAELVLNKLRGMYSTVDWY